MPIANTNPNPKDVVILQRDTTNTYYAETHISASDVILHIDSTGFLTADKSSSFYTLYPPPGVPSGTSISSSWASRSLSSSNADTASFLLGSVASAITATSSSWASHSLSSSFAQTASFLLGSVAFTLSSSWASASIFSTSASFASASAFSISASWASQSLFNLSSSWSSASITSTSASYAVNTSNSDTASFLLGSITSAIYATSASWASSSLTASFLLGSVESSIYATSASWASRSLSSSNADTASFLLGNVDSANFSISSSWASSSIFSISASWSPSGNAGTTLVTASTYPITSSWAVSASWAPGGVASNTGKVVVLCSAHTPTATGADGAEVPMPYDSMDGITPVTWSVKRINFRVQSSGNTPSTVTIEKSTGTGIFSAASLGTITLSASLFETFTGSTGAIYSGEKMRFNVDTLGTATNWTLTTEIGSI